MQRFLYKMNTPRAVIILLTLFLIINGLLYYPFQNAFGRNPTSASSEVPASDTEGKATRDSTPEPGGARGAKPESGSAKGENAEKGRAEGENTEGDTTEEASRSAESGAGSAGSGDGAGVPTGTGSQSAPVSVAAWCAPEAIRGEPTAVVLAASAGRWATVAAVQEISEPVWQRIATVTEPTWRWLAPSREDDTEAPGAAPAGPSEAPVEDVQETTMETMPETTVESTTGTASDVPQGPTVEEDTQYTDGGSTSAAPQDIPSTASPGAGEATSSGASEATSSAGGVTSSMGGQ